MPDDQMPDLEFSTGEILALLFFCAASAGVALYLFKLIFTF